MTRFIQNRGNMFDLGYLTKNNADRFDLQPGQPVMKAIVTTGNGGYDKLEYRDVPIPVPRHGEVLLRVLAAGMNNTEINTRLGWYSSSVTNGTEDLSGSKTASNIEDGGWNGKTPFPIIQGTDCCGEVIAHGNGVSTPHIGCRVLVRACMRLRGFGSLENIWMASDFDGAFAEFVCVPASEVFAVDCSWSDIELATIPCAYGTAENMLSRAGVTAADRVLVTGASGGVGSAAVQLAKRRGANVTALVGRTKLQQCRQLGADHLLAREVDLGEQLDESSFDIIVDNVAGGNFAQLLKLLVRGGRYTSSGAIAGPIVNMDMRDFYLKDLLLIGCTAWDEPVFPNLVAYIERDEIKPLVAQCHGLAEIAVAQQKFMQKTHIGNFVLTPPRTG